MDQLKWENGQFYVSTIERESLVEVSIRPFETMVFARHKSAWDTNNPVFEKRYATEEEAKKGHDDTVKIYASKSSN